MSEHSSVRADQMKLGASMWSWVAVCHSPLLEGVSASIHVAAALPVTAAGMVMCIGVQLFMIRAVQSCDVQLGSYSELGASAHRGNCARR